MGGWIIRYDAIFFDFDGVLVESADIKTDAFRELYGEFGPEVVQRCVAHHIRHGGISRVRKIEMYHREYLGQPLSQADLDDWVGRYASIVESKVVAVCAVPGAVEFLQAVRGQMKLYVISGTPEDELRRIVTKRGWDEYFDEVHGSPRLKPEIIDDITTRNGLDLKRVLFVGDAMTDYDAAHDRNVAFLGRVAPHHSNLFPPGTETVPDLTDLLERVSG
ncbi:HAD family hydrolase [Magnetovibrio sp.]|uniref:HAD family hydrolase n=1 Tax=Magnetovibrio sp. TaxID=2024836 RepID=UPI002F93F7EA